MIIHNAFERSDTSRRILLELVSRVMQAVQLTDNLPVVAGLLPASMTDAVNYLCDWRAASQAEYSVPRQHIGVDRISPEGLIPSSRQ